MKKIQKRLLFILGVTLLLGACSKMNDLHDVYLRRGETIYVGKPDSVKIFGGKERIKIRFWSSDPKAANLVIYWLNRTDSIVFSIPPHVATDSLEVIIPNLPEYNYSFEFVTTNKIFGNKSVPLEVNGNSYGANFQSSLLDRLISSTTLLTINQLEIKWLGTIEKGIGNEITYVNTSGVSKRIYVPMSDAQTLIDSVDLLKGIKTRTLFLPEPNAIDTFYTAFKDIPFEKIVIMDRSLFARWNPPGIPYKEYYTTFSIENLWDDDPGTRYFYLAPAFPDNFTFDLGQTSIISRINVKMDPGQLFSGQSVKEFEIWASASANVTDDFSVGWVKLGSYIFNKPTESGGSAKDNTALGLSGENFSVNADAPAVRYVRFVIKSTWGAGLYTTLAEVTFFKPL